MSIDGTSRRHELRSEERRPRDLLLLKLIPLLRTELDDLGLAIYKHLTLNRVKSQFTSLIFSRPTLEVRC